MTASATSADKIVFMAVSSSLTNPAEMRDEGKLVRGCIVLMLRLLIFCIVCCVSWVACSRTAASFYANGAVPAGPYLPACSRSLRDKLPSLSMRRRFISFVSDGGGPCNSHAIIILRN